MARPPQFGKRMTGRVVVRITADQKKLIDEKAKVAGETPSGYVRRVLALALRKGF